MRHTKLIAAARENACGTCKTKHTRTRREILLACWIARALSHLALALRLRDGKNVLLCTHAYTARVCVMLCMDGFATTLRVLCVVCLLSLPFAIPYMNFAAVLHCSLSTCVCVYIYMRVYASRLSPPYVFTERTRATRVPNDESARNTTRARIRKTTDDMRTNKLTALT